MDSLNIEAHWEENNLVISMDDNLYDELIKICRNDYGTTLEDLTEQYIKWTVENPDKFKAWAQELGYIQ